MDLPENSRLLLFGSAATLLPFLDVNAAPDSVVVVDDPDVLTRKGFWDKADRFQAVDSVIGADIYQSDDWLEPLEKAHRERPFTAVIPALDYTSVIAARFAERVGLPGAGAAAARFMREKHALMARAAEAGIGCPSSAVVHSAAEIRVPTQSRRWILKPVDRRASVGVQVLEADADLDAAWAFSSGAVERSYRDSMFAGSCLVQPYLEGPEFSVECLVIDGAVIFSNVTEKLVQAGACPVELGHVVPARLSDDSCQELVGQTRRLIAATGFRTGVVHAEWIVQDGTPYVVDCARLPGDSIVELIDIAYRVHLEGALIRVLSGLDVEVATRPVRASAISFFNPPAGKVVAVRGAQEARASDGVIRLKVPEPGAVIPEVVDSWSRTGEMLVEATDSDEAVQRIARAIGHLELDVIAEGSNGVLTSGMHPGSRWSTSVSATHTR